MTRLVALLALLSPTVGLADPIRDLAARMVGTWGTKTGGGCLCTIADEQISCYFSDSTGAPKILETELFVRWDEVAGGYALTLTAGAKRSLYLGTLAGDQLSAEHRPLDGTGQRRLSWDFSELGRWVWRTDGNFSESTMERVPQPPAAVTRARDQLRLLGASYCFLKDAKKANEIYRRMNAQGRQFLRYVCDRNGIGLPSGRSPCR